MGERDHSIECETCGVMRGGLNDLECECEDNRWRERPYVIEMQRRQALLDLGIHLANLAACLREAAGLEVAFSLGYEQREHERLYSDHGYRKEQDWRPGCGRALAGWEAGT
jgi:hypothetical protein